MKAVILVASLALLIAVGFKYALASPASSAVVAPLPSPASTGPPPPTQQPKPRKERFLTSAQLKRVDRAEKNVDRVMSPFVVSEETCQGRYLETPAETVQCYATAYARYVASIQAPLRPMRALAQKTTGACLGQFEVLLGPRGPVARFSQAATRAYHGANQQGQLSYDERLALLKWRGLTSKRFGFIDLECDVTKQYVLQ